MRAEASTHRSQSDFSKGLWARGLTTSDREGASASLQPQLHWHPKSGAQPFPSRKLFGW